MTRIASLPQRGFTLIEVLIAMALFATLSALAYTGLQSVINSKDDTEFELQRLKQIQLSVMHLTKDLSQLSQRDATDALGGRLYRLSTQESDYTVSFTRNGWRNFAQQNRSTLQRVAYHLEENQLIRTYWMHIDRADEEIKVERAILDNVTDLTFRFLDPDNQWQDDWPDASTLSSGTSVSLPLAVEIRLTLGDWGEITRLVRVLQ